MVIITNEHCFCFWRLAIKGLLSKKQKIPKWHQNCSFLFFQKAIFDQIKITLNTLNFHRRHLLNHKKQLRTGEQKSNLLHFIFFINKQLIDIYQ